jgi:hypothetical protein
MNIDINELSGGAVGERINIELQKVFENIKDPNTDWKKARKLTVTLTLSPDENRDIALVGVDAKPTLAPARGVATKFIIDRDNKGKAVGAELVSGAKNQMMFDPTTGEVLDDRGKKVDADKPADGKVVQFK